MNDCRRGHDCNHIAMQTMYLRINTLEEKIATAKCDAICIEMAKRWTLSTVQRVVAATQSSHIHAHFPHKTKMESYFIITHFVLQIIIIVGFSVGGSHILCCGVTNVAFFCIARHTVVVAVVARAVVVAVIERNHRVHSRFHSLFVRGAARSHGNWQQTVCSLCTSEGAKIPMNSLRLHTILRSTTHTTTVAVPRTSFHCNADLMHTWMFAFCTSFDISFVWCVVCRYFFAAAQRKMGKIRFRHREKISSAQHNLYVIRSHEVIVYAEGH